MAAADDALKSRFENALARSKTLAQRPDNTDLLGLYALYKQVSEGDVGDDRPGAMDFVALAKWNARTQLRGTSSAQAMQSYIELVDRLAGNSG